MKLKLSLALLLIVCSCAYAQENITQFCQTPEQQQGMLTRPVFIVTNASQMSSYLLDKKTLGREIFTVELIADENGQDVSVIYVTDDWFATFMRIDSEESYSSVVTTDCYDSSINFSMCTRDEETLSNGAQANYWLSMKKNPDISNPLGRTGEIFCTIKAVPAANLTVRVFNWYFIPVDSFSLYFGKSKYCRDEYTGNCYSSPQLQGVCDVKNRTEFEAFHEGFSGIIETNGALWRITSNIFVIVIWVFIIIVIPILTLLWVKSYIEKIAGREKRRR